MTGQPPPPDGYLLDKFSEEDVVSWKKRADVSEEYTLRLHYHLEALRRLHYSDLCRALKSSEVISVNETWTRITDFKYLDNPLSPKGSIIRGQRFNIGNDLRDQTSFPCLYLGEDEQSSHREKFGTPYVANGLSADELALRKPASYGFINVNVEVKYVFDLTKAANLKPYVDIIKKFSVPKELKELSKQAGAGRVHLISKASELKNSLLEANWNYNPSQYSLPSNSQLFGKFLVDAEFGGVLFPSARMPGKNCLGLFVQNFGDGDMVELADDPHSGVLYSKITSENWKDVIK